MYNPTRHQVCVEGGSRKGDASVYGCSALIRPLTLLFPQLVPKHEVLSSEEKASLLKQYNLSPDNLPRMMPEDTIARYFGLEVGQVGFLTACDGGTADAFAWHC